jgi:hexosaminidase
MREMNTSLWELSADSDIATIDLGERIQLKQLGLNALQNKALGIYMPARIDFSASEDGREFKPIVSLKPETAPSFAGPKTETILSRQLGSISARYLRVHAQSLETIPAGNPAAGRPAWLFTSEIIVNPGKPESQDRL